jgi:hypothetical protein
MTPSKPLPDAGEERVLIYTRVEEFCTHRRGDVLGMGPNPRCGKRAVVKRNGMRRCDNHRSDLDPRTWPEVIGRYCDE